MTTQPSQHESQVVAPFQRQTREQAAEAVRSIAGPTIHAVMLQFHDSAPQARVDGLIGELNELSKRPEVLAWMVLPESVDTRKGRVALELGIFASGEAFMTWRNSEEHIHFAQGMAENGDWLVFDGPASALAGQDGQSEIGVGAFSRVLQENNAQAPTNPQA